MFTIWLASSTIPPWGYDDENQIVATIPLPNGETVLLGSHYVDAKAATKSMLKGLAGFVQALMAEETTPLEPLETDATLMGLSTERVGTRIITEIALWSLTTADTVDSAAGLEPVLHDISDDLTQCLIDISVPIPPSVFAARGVDPTVDLDATRAISHDWNEAKLSDMRRILRLPTSG
jgi:hypothetical protein